MACAAVNCTTRHSKGFRMFRFPREPIRCKRWVQNMKRDNWKPTDSSKLCEIHFEKSQYKNNRVDQWKKLKWDAIPTIFDIPNAPKLLDIPRLSIYKRLKVDTQSDIGNQNLSPVPVIANDSIVSTSPSIDAKFAPMQLFS